MNKLKHEGDLDNDNAIRNALLQFKIVTLFHRIYSKKNTLQKQQTKQINNEN